MTPKEKLNKLEREASGEIIKAISQDKPVEEVQALGLTYFNMVDEHERMGYYNHKNFSYLLKHYNRYVGMRI